MSLYRLNLHLSASMLKVVAMFEVCLRNQIDRIMETIWGTDWLRDSTLPGGIFASNPKCKDTTAIILSTYLKLNNKGIYTHNKLIAELDFGNWRYMFSPSQYKASGRVLLGMFPYKPISSKACQYNNTYVFNRLSEINHIRNRIAHHEPICFDFNTISTVKVNEAYNSILDLLGWMGINTSEFLRGIDNVQSICKRITKI